MISYAEAPIRRTGAHFMGEWPDGVQLTERLAKRVIEAFERKGAPLTMEESKVIIEADAKEG